MDQETAKTAEEAARHGFHIGELAAGAAAALAAFVGGRKSGRAAVVDELLATFRAEAEATRETMRQEAESTRHAIADAIGGLHRRLDMVVQDVARIDGRTERRRDG